MAIGEVSLRIQSTALSASQLQALFERDGERLTERGSPVSSRQPDGPCHSVSTLSFVSTACGEELGPHLKSLHWALATITEARRSNLDLTADLCVLVSSRPMGFAVFFDEDVVNTLSAARCGIMVDTYSDTQG